MIRYLFFIQKQNGRGKSLFTLPKQKLTSRTALIDDCMTHGCESVRKKYPVGTVFAADSTNVRQRGGCYTVSSLIPFLLPDGNYASTDIFLQEAQDQYSELLSKIV